MHDLSGFPDLDQFGDSPVIQRDLASARRLPESFGVKFRSSSPGLPLHYRSIFKLVHLWCLQLDPHRSVHPLECCFLLSVLQTNTLLQSVCEHILRQSHVLILVGLH